VGANAHCGEEHCQCGHDPSRSDPYLVLRSRR